MVENRLVQLNCTASLNKMPRPSAFIKRQREKNKLATEARKRIRLENEAGDDVGENDVEDEAVLENSWVEISDDEEETQSDNDIEPHETSTEVEIIESVRDSESIPLFTVMCTVLVMVSLL